MSDPSIPPEFPSVLSPEDLLIYAPGLQRLAARLVGVDLADDLLQDTWVRALERPPSSRQPLGPWLVRVLSNLAISSHRRRARRREKECDLKGIDEQEQPLPAPDEIGAQLEAAEKVMGAMASLDDLHRKVIALRYLRGMPSGQIGEALNLPASTVRWHIQNAVAKMRVSLANQGRDLTEGQPGDWVACVVPLLLGTDRAATGKLGAALTVGPPSVPVVSLGGPMLLASAVLSFIGVLAHLFVSSKGLEPLQAPQEIAFIERASPSRGAPGSARESRSAVRPMLEVQASLMDPKAGVERRAAVLEKPSLQAPPARHHSGSRTGEPESEHEAAWARICSRIVGVDQTPIPEAELAWDRSDPSASGEFAVAGSDGRLGLSLPDVSAASRMTGEFRISAPGHASRRVGWPLWMGRDFRLGDLTLVESRPLDGTVLDPDGTPIQGATVTSAWADGKDESAPVITDSYGHFKLAEVPREHGQVTAKMDGYRSVTVFPLKSFEGQLKLFLEPSEASPKLALLVVDPDDVPVSNAAISLSRSGHEPATFVADSNGQLAASLGASNGHGPGSPPEGDVVAFDEALAFAPTRIESVPLDGQQRKVTLEKGRSLRFIVRAPGGAPMKGFQWFHPESIHRPSPMIRWGEVADKNELEIAVATGLAASQSEEGIVVLAEGFAPVSMEFRDALKSGRAIHLHLTPEETVEVHVVQGDLPVQKAVVTAIPIGGGPLSRGPAGSGRRGEPQTFRTDVNGAFHIPASAYRPLMLRVEVSGLAPWFHHHVGNGSPVDLKTIRLQSGGTIVGRTPVALSASGKRSLTQARALLATHQHGEVAVVSMDGSPFFQLHGLTPGRWHLRWLDRDDASECSVEANRNEYAVDVVAGNATYVNEWELLQLDGDSG